MSLSKFFTGASIKPVSVGCHFGRIGKKHDASCYCKGTGSLLIMRNNFYPNTEEEWTRVYAILNRKKILRRMGDEEFA